MRCHYEVLGLERDATTEEIKKAYRKFALKWHPDKNVGNEEEATARFKEVTAAQTVLSDPHERKWYDDHREAILRGGSGTAQSNDEDDGSPIINLWPFFNGSCYSGFDGPEGFFAVYGKVFEDIHEVDCRDCSSTDAKSTFVPFGDSSSAQKEVFNFYSQWSNFVSQLAFSWADEYNTLEAPNRQIKRAMEKENKKKRDAARKKYVETVRALVDYVKRRDIRYIRYEKEVRLRREEEEAERARKNLERKEEKQRQRKEMRERMQHELEKEELLRHEERKGAFLLADASDDEYVDEINCGIEGMLEEDGREDSDSDSEVETKEVVFTCDICNKQFKTESQQQQHFTSKVHRKKVQEIAKREKSKTNKSKGKIIQGKREPDSIQQKRNDDTESTKKTAKEDKSVDPLDNSIFSCVPDLIVSKEESRKSQKKKNTILKEESDNESVSSASDSSSDDLLKLSQVKINSKCHSEGSNTSDSDDCGDDDDNIEKIEKNDSTKEIVSEVEYEIITPGSHVVEETTANASQGKKQKKLESNQKSSAGNSTVTSAICQICGFDAEGSRNKLFQHIKDFGHAAYKDDLIMPQQTAQKLSKKEKKKKKTGKGVNTRRNEYRY